MVDKPVTTWADDVRLMHAKFGQTVIFKRMSGKTLQEFLKFRIRFILEELHEMIEASQLQDPDKFVDALIDMCVVAIGTLDAMGVNPQQAWEVVRDANMAKTPGMNDNRVNPFGFPDLVKPDGWQPPNHFDNLGRLLEAMEVVQ